jgi:tyrosyl-tRNA synthetase
MLTPFDYWQYFRNIADSDIVKIASLLTDIEDVGIEDIKNRLQNAKNADEINEIKIFVATEVTKICHGISIAKVVEEEARIKFSSQNDLTNVKSDLFIMFDDLINMTIMDLLKKLTTDKSNSQLKTLILQNSIKINDVSVSDIGYKILQDCFEKHGERKLIRIGVGKKDKFIVEIN